jgi:HSP20 family protein
MMTLTKRNGNLLNPLPTLFDDFFNRDLFNWGNLNFSNTNTTIPAINIKETPDNYIVEVAAPGMSKKDFKVELDGNTLTISSEKSREEEDKEDEKYSRKEFSYQSFQRTFTLQKDVVDIDKIEARYENGLLHLAIPKKEEAKQKPPRLIEIS